VSRPRKNQRLFVAAYPPPALARSMLDLLDDIALPAHRRTPADQVHLTLQFIGDTPVNRLDETIESVEKATGGLAAGMLEPRRLVALPERGHARLIAVVLDASPSLLELQRRLATRLAHNVRARPGDRYLPHITLCRFRAPAPPPALAADVELEAFPVTTVRVMRSALKPDGARHLEVASFELDA
jgi:2'-5' RNA ligase